MARGKLIVIDGMDGSGKGTQIEKLKEEFEPRGVVFVREPGNCPLAEDIRDRYIYGDKFPHDPRSDFFLFWAARVALVKEVIKPALAAGKHVVSDRFDSSTLAYQVFGKGNIELIGIFIACRLEILRSLQPITYIILDLPPEVAFGRRAKDAGQAKSRFDLEPVSYHREVRRGFHQFAAFESVRSLAHFVDAERAPEEVYEDVGKIVRETLS